MDIELTDEERNVLTSIVTCDANAIARWTVESGEALQTLEDKGLLVKQCARDGVATFAATSAGLAALTERMVA